MEFQGAMRQPSLLTITGAPSQTIKVLLAGEECLKTVRVGGPVRQHGRAAWSRRSAVTQLQRLCQLRGAATTISSTGTGPLLLFLRNLCT